MASVKVCYILSYYSPRYVRTETLVQALSDIPGCQLFEARNNSKSFVRYLETLLKLFVIRFFHKPDIYILGFRGHEIFWPVRIITLGKQLIFDELMSPYDSLVNEKKALRKGSLIERAAYHYERKALQTSDLILTDTQLHVDFLANTFRIHKSRILPVPVSADERVFIRPTRWQNKQNMLFTVLFYGSFLPLHGIDTLIGAAKYLADTPIQFILVGGDKKKIANFKREIVRLDLNNVIHRKWVNYDELPELISISDLGLGGPFGNTGQAQRIITGKTYQFLAMGKATVVGRISGDYGFRDKENCLLVPQGHAQELADAIQWAFDNSYLLKDIGEQGHQLYLSQFAGSKIRQQLQKILDAKVSGNLDPTTNHH